MNEQTHQEIYVRMESLEGKLDTFMAEMRTSVDQVKTDVSAMKSDVAQTKEIVEAWSAVKTLGKGLKWFSGMLTAFAAGWIILKAGLSAMVK